MPDKSFYYCKFIFDKSRNQISFRTIFSGKLAPPIRNLDSNPFTNELPYLTEGPSR